ncbi:TPA: hypothetical protein L9493_001013 [Klebsiella variicola subsp. variicola]|nr:hypothetical protein [Klebsiella variicola subsp. variicola]HBS3663198.1 hypothetical protein [Klebsiella variicola subsp. variicola]
MKPHFIELTGVFENFPIPEGVKSGDEVKFIISFKDEGDASKMTIDIAPITPNGGSYLRNETGVEYELREIITANLRDEMGCMVYSLAADIAADIVSRISPHEEIGSLTQLGLASRKYIAAVDLIGDAVRASGAGSAGDNIFDVAKKLI